MTKSWQPYAHHILDAAEKIHRIQARGDIDPLTVVGVVNKHLQPLVNAVQAMLAMRP